MRRYDRQGALDLARAACRGAGASAAVAESLAQATVSAELHARPSVGFSHLLDYLAGFQDGRIAGAATPDLAFPATCVIRCDARGGIAQLGFDLAFAT